MILAIDGYEANVAHRVGIGTFAYELLVRIVDLIAEGKTAFSKVRIYLPSAPLADMPKASDRVEYRVVGPQKFWTFWALPRSIMHDQPQASVVFSPTHYIPRFIQTPRVMSIMDVSYLSFPELFRPQDLHKLVHWTAYSAARARAIITISEFSKNAIIKAYKTGKTRVDVVYPGLVQKTASMSTKTDTHTSYNLPKRYILAVGTLQPRKNYTKLIEAFSRLEDTDVSLVIVGKKGWLYEEILAAPEQYGVADRVKFLDFVPDADLPTLYKNAECFVLPSLYEGFGLPVLEAMAHHTTVVISRVSSLPEIGGDAAIYVDPEVVTSITQGLSQALKEHGTKAEKTRIARADKRVALFDWDMAAKHVLEILTDVAKQGGKV
jgi:glycosyltransferase involved in cell wall biosynthesis